MNMTSRILAGLFVLLLVGCGDDVPQTPDATLAQDVFAPGGDTDKDHPLECRSGLFPDPVTGTCVPCTEDAHCVVGDVDLVCHPESRECVGCVDDVDCRHGFCVPEKSYCAQCFADDHCSSGTCNLTLDVCVGCGVDSDCDDGNDCTAGVCAEGECRH
ncbi:MAG: hypothetical protein ACI9WU_005110, partial [Myxococcota bacterium]